MASVTVTCTIGPTVHYRFTPQAKEDITGLGVTVPDIVYGWMAAAATPQTLSVVLDDSYVWDVELRFKNAAPIVFDGFKPASGDLLTQLAAQGWIGL